MPTQRTPLGPISGNRIKKKEISSFIRGVIVGKYSKGATQREIAKDLKIPKSTIHYTLKQALLRNDGESLVRAGAPTLSTDRDERMILRYIRLHLKTTYADIKQDCGVIISHSSIKRILRKHGISTWRAKKRPELTEAVAAKRLEWASLREHWDATDFYNIQWSNECFAERGTGKKGSWCFGIPINKYLPQFVDTYSKSKDISVMVWGAFWFEDYKIRKSDLYILDRDFEFKKHGYSSRSYLEVLNDQIPRIWSPGLIFM